MMACLASTSGGESQFQIIYALYMPLSIVDCCVCLLFATGNAWNMTGSEYNAFIHLQVTLHFIVWLLWKCRFLLSPPHVVLPFTTGNAWNMTASEYKASIHLQVTLCCIVWLLLTCHFLLPPPSCCCPLHNWECMKHDRLWVKCIHSSARDTVLHCVVAIKLPFLLPPPHVVLPFTTWNAWNMTESEYNASIHLQVILRCIVWLLSSWHFLLPPLMFFSSSQLGMHGTWQGVSIMHPFICKWYCVALCGCY